MSDELERSDRPLDSGVTRIPEDAEGLGPHSYELPDQTIHEDVLGLIQREAGIDVDTITVQVDRGDVTLSGGVPDRESAQKAESAARHAPGVREVHNRLQVASWIG